MPMLSPRIAGPSRNDGSNDATISRSTMSARLVSTLMERLCGRPGCSDRASVAYGMRAEDLVFWLDVLPDHDGDLGGVLCRRHADSMIVPRGWTLDDLRDPDLHLFRLPSPTERVRSQRSARVKVADATGEQLRLTDEDLEAVPEPSVTAGVPAPVADSDPMRTDEEGGPWTPTFDEADDLDGLLSAQSPLLARAFRTADRPDA
jgi:hypothetical protein